MAGSIRVAFTAPVDATTVLARSGFVAEAEHSDGIASFVLQRDQAGRRGFRSPRRWKP